MHSNKFITYSLVSLDIVREAEVNGRWTAEVAAWPGMFPAGTIICDPAPGGTPDGLCFTADNGKQYMDTIAGSVFIPKT